MPALRALCAAGHRVEIVYTAPDRPAGRGRRLLASPVKQAAQGLGLELRQPPGWRDGDGPASLRAAAAELLVVADYGFILPVPVLATPRYGAVNIHGSALPRWRGAAPVARAILAGDAATGVTVIAMDAGVDTGAVLAQWCTALLPSEPAGVLEARLAQLGAACVVAVLADLPAALEGARPQPSQGVSYAAKLSKDEAWLDWRADAEQLARRVRALHPAPGTYTTWQGRRLRVLRAHAVLEAPAATPGTVLEAGGAGILVAAGRGALSLTELQIEGSRALPAAAFLAGRSVAPGERLGLS